MTAAVEPAPLSVWSPLRASASFRYLFAGQVVSLLGDQFLVVALPLIVIRSSGALALGKVLASYGIARAVALPLGGIIGDHWSRRVVMLASDAVRGLLVLALILGIGAHHGDIGFIAIVVAAIGLAEGVFLPASYAILPSTVPQSFLSRANALSGSAQNLAVLVGPGLGGLLAVAVTPRACLIVDAATFVVSAASLMFVREQWAEPDEDDVAPTRFLTFLRRTPLLQVMVLCTLLTNLAYFGMLEVALPVLSFNRLNVGGSGFGAALAAFGLGSLLGSLLIVRLDNRRRRGLVAIGLGMAQGIFFIGVVAAVPAGGGLAAVAALLCGAGIMNGVLNAFYLSRIQEVIPQRLLGRAMGLLILAVFAIHPISVAVAALVSRSAGPLPVFAAAGGSIVLAFVVGSFTRQYRDL